ncbi:unnamed protein product [Somion occarium]|uniref:BTB domain-containing protein n=1 Tax=Somion occarium TaxID=3059160 RepID=A0ABP1DEM9_9APHY
MSDVVIRVDDNSDNASSFDAKRLSVDPRFARKDSRTSAIASGPPVNICTSAFGAADPIQASKRVLHRHFIPRPFPPPALANVPVEYIVDQLHSLASNYWSKPETADCTIIVPLPMLNPPGPERASRPCSNSPEPLFPALSTQHVSGRQTSTSTPRPAPRMVMKLHMDYLSAQSKLFRGIFSGVYPPELCMQTPSGCCTPTPSTSQASHNHPSAFRSRPFNDLPRLLPSPPSQPVLFLPVPDPSSLRILIHYIYFGSTVYLEDALDRGEINWEGLARNVEYLGMGVEIKVFLGRWYGRWKRGRGESYDDDEDYDSEDSYDSEDEDLEYFEKCSSATSVSISFEDEMELEQDLKNTSLNFEPARGRNRVSRRLGHATSDPTLQASAPQHQAFFVPPSPRGRSE